MVSAVLAGGRIVGFGVAVLVRAVQRAEAVEETEAVQVAE
jgi:hypothetical protein